MFDAATRAFLEGGAALVVGTVSPDGEPYATRGWGLRVLGATAPVQVRLLLSAADLVALSDLDGTGRVAITASDVATLRSLQLKGRVIAVEPIVEDDHDLAAGYVDALFEDVVETDGIARHLLERLVPPAFVAFTVEPDELFDQTPGPGAGAAVGAS